MLNLDAYTGPPELRARLERSPLILFVVRTRPRGSQSARPACEETALVAELFRGRTGLDLTGSMPSAEEFADELTLSPRAVPWPDSPAQLGEGAILIDRSREGVAVIAWLGPSLGGNAEDDRVSVLGACIRHFRPAVIFVRTLDTLGRSSSSLARILSDLEASDCLLGDAWHGFRDVSGAANMLRGGWTESC